MLFCVHEVRYKDYAAETPGIDGAWRNQTLDGYAITERNDDHPVVNVSWEDAQKFCAWFSGKEGKVCRLPTDEEWSYAVGIGPEEMRQADTLPSQVRQVPDKFPWDGGFPPRTTDRAGNYSDESRKAKVTRGTPQYLENFDDDHPTTAPVMSYRPNKFGLYDLGGNVSEWVEDWYDSSGKQCVLRGATWIGFVRDNLLSSYRAHNAPGTRRTNLGFRVVVEKG